MKVVFYFKTEIADQKIDSRTAFRYPFLQLILKGYIKTCTQRIFTNLTEFWIVDLKKELKENLTLPLGQTSKFTLKESKAFIASRSIYAIYFDNLVSLQASKLDSYLMASEGYLGLCVLHQISHSVGRFDGKMPLLKIKNRSISILINKFREIEEYRDIVLEEIIKHISFESWNYEEIQSSSNYWFQYIIRADDLGIQ